MFELIYQPMFNPFDGDGDSGGTTETIEGEGGTEEPEGSPDDGEDNAITDEKGRKLVPLKALHKEREKLRELQAKNANMQTTMQDLAKSEMENPGTFRERLKQLGYKGPEKELSKVETKAEDIQGRLDDLKPGEKPDKQLMKDIAELKSTVGQVVQGLQFVYKQGIDRDYRMTMKELKAEIVSDYPPKTAALIEEKAELLLAKRTAKSEKEALVMAKKAYDESYDERTKSAAQRSEEKERRRSGQPVELESDALEFLKVDISEIDDRKKKRDAVQDGWAKIKRMGS